MRFIVENPDYNLSPHTGMTKKHWLEVCRFLLSGVFSHIKNPDDPIVLPRHDYEISYPQPNDPEWRYGSEKFEGLARTFLVSSQMINNQPDAKIGDFNLKEYYANQILLALKKESKSYIGRLDEILKAPGIRVAFQHTVECASLTLGLMVTKEHIWDQYSVKEQDKIAELFSEFGHSRTNQHNWRLFNIMILTFLKLNGYVINEKILKDHLMNVMAFYAGNGWYRDGQLFDYYSPWAFQFYTPIWNAWYGYAHEPELAAAFEKNSNELMKSYTSFFDEEGKSLMWGRSNIYRSAASAPLAANLFLKNPAVSPGLARRILSGNLLQFMGSEQTFINNIPCLGFYGPFKPMVQTYSCTSSPFWLANSFMCLSLPDDSALWTETENNGVWESLGDQSHQISLDGPGMLLVNHGKAGTTELLTSKIMLKSNDPWIPEYAKLAFNSAFPWEAHGDKGPIAMQYSLKAAKKPYFTTPNFMLYAGYRDGVLYRRIYFDFDGNFKDNPSIDLADIIIPGGIIRVDRVKIAEKPNELMLGHYGLPKLGKTKVAKRQVNGHEVLTAGTEHLKLAFINYSGWDALDYEENSGLNALADDSILLYGKRKKEIFYDGVEIIITVMLHGKDDEEWTDEELTPIAAIEYCEALPSSGACGVRITLRDGKTVVVDYGSIEGNLTV